MNYKKLADVIYKLQHEDNIDNIVVNMNGQVLEFFPGTAPENRWIKSVCNRGKLHLFHYIGSDGRVQNFIAENGNIYGKSSSVFSIYPYQSAQDHYREMYAEAIAQLTMPTFD